VLAKDTGSTIEKLTIFITTSFTFFIFSKVSFVELSLTLLEGEKISIGGLALNILKQLKGLKLTLPFSSILLANAIGLGATDNKSILCNSLVDKLFGSMEVNLFILSILF
jgi:hypothetical protein